MVFDFRQCFGYVMRNDQYYNGLASTSGGTARVFRRPYGSGDGTGMQRRQIHLSLWSRTIG
jgi:hypothetical protein